jgi:hypothetical protein
MYSLVVEDLSGNARGDVPLCESESLRRYGSSDNLGGGFASNDRDRGWGACDSGQNSGQNRDGGRWGCRGSSNCRIISRVHVSDNERLWIRSTLSKSHAFGPRLNEAALLLFGLAAESMAEDRGSGTNSDLDGRSGIALRLAGGLLADGGLGLCGLNNGRAVRCTLDSEESLGRRCEYCRWCHGFSGCDCCGRAGHRAGIQDRCDCLRVGVGFG